MKIKPCLFCGTNCTGQATSKEHVISQAQRRRVAQKGANLGNLKARFRGITCQTCNETLGRIEQSSLSGQAIAASWKILAGNSNQVFERANWARTKLTDDQTLNYYMSLLKKALLTSNALPEAMFSYDLTYIKKIRLDANNKVDILSFGEGVIIFQDYALVNEAEKERSNKVIVDCIIYHSHTRNGPRIFFILPLVPEKYLQHIYYTFDRSKIEQIAHRLIVGKSDAILSLYRLE